MLDQCVLIVWHHVNCMSTVVRSKSGIAIDEPLLIKQFVDVAFLRQLNCEEIVFCQLPLAVDSKTPQNFPHKINIEAAAERLLKPFFGGIISAEADAVIDVCHKADCAPCGQSASKCTWII